MTSLRTLRSTVGTPRGGRSLPTGVECRIEGELDPAKEGDLVLAKNWRSWALVG
jgi:hypothetical protein